MFKSKYLNKKLKNINIETRGDLTNLNPTYPIHLHCYFIGNLKYVIF